LGGAIFLLVAVHGLCGGESYLYPLDFAPPREPLEVVLAREKKFEDAWRAYFARLDGMVRNPDKRDLDQFIKSSRGEALLLLANEYGYAQLKDPALGKLKSTFLREIELAEKALAPKGIADIGEAIDLGRALDAAVWLKRHGRYTPDLAAKAEALIEKYVDGKSVFWGFTRKFPYYLSGYNKEAIIMDLAASTKALYQGTGRFRNTIDAFDAAWTQIATQAYETDNSPHYDSSVNLHFVFRWVVLLNLADDLKRASHFRMILDRMARTVMANGESANYGKSMCRLYSRKAAGVSVDEVWVEGGGIGRCLRWAYRLYGDPQFLYVARKYEMTDGGGRAPVTLMPKAFDLNFFDVKGAAYGTNAPLSFTTIRLKGQGGYLDRGIRRENIQPVQDKLMLSTGSDPRSPFMLMDLSFTQSKVKDKRRMGIDNLIFNGTHLVTVVGRPDNPEETNRIFLAPDDIEYPGTGEFQGQKSQQTDAQDYELRDYFATRVGLGLAYGQVEYSRLQYEGVHAKRRMALLNNGVLAVEDLVWADGRYKGRKNAGALYNVWSKVLARGANWLVTSPRIGHLPSGRMESPLCALLYFAPARDIKCGMNKDIDFYAYAPLTKEKPVRIVSAVIPMPFAAAVAIGRSVGDGIRSDTDTAGNTSVRIPYGSNQTLRVTFLATGSVPACCALENAGGEAAAAIGRSPPRMNARANAPYSVAFGRTNEWCVPGFKVDLELNEHVVADVFCGGNRLSRDAEYWRVGNVLGLTPAFAKTLTDAHARTNLTIRFDSGADVVLKLNGDTRPCITLSNARRSRSYTADEMVMPYGFRDNTRIKAVAGDFEVAFYDDWVFRGKPTVVQVRSGQSVNLPSKTYRSFKVKRTDP
jgi:hypothetical protein